MKAPLTFLDPRPGWDWRALEDALWQLQHGQIRIAWDAILSVLAYHESVAIARALAVETPDRETLIAKGEAKAFKRAKMVLKDIETDLKRIRQGAPPNA